MRNDQLIRQHRLILRLLDGRARQVEHFEDIRIDAKVGRKALLRDLDAISRIPELQITTVKRPSGVWYSSNGRFAADAGAARGPKHCNKCNELKPSDAFGKNRHNADGRETQCLACRKVWRLAWRAKNRLRYNARMRRWRQRRRSRDFSGRQNRVKGSDALLA